MMKFLDVKLVSVIAALALATAAPCPAQTREVLDAAVSETLHQFNLIDPQHAVLESHAAGILIFPQVSKGGIALASGYGEGVLQINGKTVDYYSIASASVGLTAGIGAHSEVIMFMTPESLDKFAQSKGWSLSADSGLAVISTGVANAYERSAMKKPVLVFVFGEKGLIADLSLQGSKINKIAK
jgi:lipid-binding SYLF domain-containing protein